MNVADGVAEHVKLHLGAANGCRLSVISRRKRVFPLIDDTPAPALQFDRERLIELRKRALMSRALLAVKSRRSFTAICRIEQGHTQPKADTLGQLASALDVEPGDLLRPTRPADGFTYDAPVGYGDGPYGSGLYGEDSDGI
jgi:Helix-turn-helix domain